MGCGISSASVSAVGECALCAAGTYKSGKGSYSDACVSCPPLSDSGGGAGVCTCVTGYSGTAGDCTAVCGDGLVLGSEACDDGNAVSGDACSASCGVEAHATCSGEPSVCACDADYYTPSGGNACSRLCTSVATCNGQGTCSSAGACSCARSVFGANCETLVEAIASESLAISDVTLPATVSVGSSVRQTTPFRVIFARVVRLFSS